MNALHPGAAKIAEVQSILEQMFAAYLKQNNLRRVSDAEFARWLGVGPSGWCYWVNGTRLPDLRNSLIMATRVEQLLGTEARLHFLEVLGYEDLYEVTDPGLRDLVAAWDVLPRVVKERIHELAVQEVQGVGRAAV